jgi:salicylate hydroxylase
MESSMRVLIIGGGIGGLALAAGLRRRGFEVTVVERDDDLARTGGYHITLDPRAQAALEDLIGPGPMRRILASSAAVQERAEDVMWDWKGRLVAELPGVVDDDAVDIDRVTLRLLLAEAAGDDLVTGRTFVGYDETDDGVVARFSDGGELSADVLVAADGAHSSITRRLHGADTAHPTGLVGISGRTAAAALSERERARLGIRSSFAVGPRGTALYAGYLDPVGHAALTAPGLSAARTTETTFIWGAMLPDRDARPLRGLRGPALRAATIAALRRRGWAEAPLELISSSAPESIATYRFNAASPRAADLADWPAGAVTALGDAVHATPPTAGMGAGIALRDAAGLRTALDEVRGGRPLAEAVAEYERAMAVRGAEAIALAMTTVARVLATDSAVGSLILRITTPVMAALARRRSGTRSIARDEIRRRRNPS